MQKKVLFSDIYLILLCFLISNLKMFNITRKARFSSEPERKFLHLEQIAGPFKKLIRLEYYARCIHRLIVLVLIFPIQKSKVKLFC